MNTPIAHPLGLDMYTLIMQSCPQDFRPEKEGFKGSGNDFGVFKWELLKSSLVYETML